LYTWQVWICSNKPTSGHFSWMSGVVTRMVVLRRMPRFSAPSLIRTMPNQHNADRRTPLETENGGGERGRIGCRAAPFRRGPISKMRHSYFAQTLAVTFTLDNKRYQ